VFLSKSILFFKSIFVCEPDKYQAVRYIRRKHYPNTIYYRNSLNEDTVMSPVTDHPQ